MQMIPANEHSQLATRQAGICSGPSRAGPNRALGFICFGNFLNLTHFPPECSRALLLTPARRLTCCPCLPSVPPWLSLLLVLICNKGKWWSPTTWQRPHPLCSDESRCLLDLLAALRLELCDAATPRRNLTLLIWTSHTLFYGCVECGVDLGRRGASGH